MKGTKPDLCKGLAPFLGPTDGPVCHKDTCCVVGCHSWTGQGRRPEGACRGWNLTMRCPASLMFSLFYYSKIQLRHIVVT